MSGEGRMVEDGGRVEGWIWGTDGMVEGEEWGWRDGS